MNGTPEHPLVSVVIPAFQAERFLADVLESARAQTYRHLEVIVVDDGSTDATADVVQRFPEVVCVRLGTNRGLPAARNAGIEAARGELIAFIDADDIMLPDRVEVQARYLLAHPGCAGVLPRQELFVDPGAVLPPGVTPLDREGNPLLLTSALMVRASALQAIGGYDIAYSASEDIDLVIRLKSAGYVIEILDPVLIRRRFHGDNMSYDRDLLRHGLLQSIRQQIRRERPQVNPSS